MQTHVPKISLIKKQRDYLSFRKDKRRYLVGFHDHHLAHYIKNSLPDISDLYMDMFKEKCHPIPINKNIYRFDGVKLIVPKKDTCVNIDLLNGYWSDSDNDDFGYVVEEMDLESFIDKPYQYIIPYDIMQSSKGQTILKCSLIEKYNN